MKIFFVLSASALIIAACSNNKSPEATNETSDNPFFEESILPYQTIDFSKIKDEDFEPALLEGMKQQLTEIDSIANNPEPPTFENTLVALERSGRLLERVNNTFNLLTGANTNPTLQKVQEDIAPRLAAHQDALFLNAKLFERIKAIYNSDQSKLDAESQKLVQYYYEKFILSGATLSEDDKARLKKYNEEEASLSAKFTNKLLAAAKGSAFITDDKTALGGLSEAEIDAAAKNASEAGQKSNYLLPLQNTTQQPEFKSLKNRSTRKNIFELSWNRAERGDSTDTRSTISRIAQIRAEKARLLGFKNFASWNLKDQMAQTPEAVENFLKKLVPASTAKAKDEASEIQKMIDQQKGGFKLEPYDWDFYAEQVRKAKYDLDENEIKPYFELNNVLEKGVFYAATQLYGITFKERKDLPVYQEDVRVFEIFNEDGSPIGLFYADFFKRDNKSGGAWMSNLVNQSELLGTKPVIYNVCNFTKPAKGQPPLISFDDVTTVFHEFGHALHGFFAKQRYLSLSGTNVARDFVEFPSQFNEHWATDPKVFKHYAIHYKTGKPMPQTLIAKINKSATFNQGYNLTELLAAASLDMQWHILNPSAELKDVDLFEKEALKKTNLDLKEVPPRYRSSYFLHIWGNGYAAGYYAYLWTEMLEEDAFSWFEQNGGLTRKNGQRFRDMILSKGNTEDYNKMFLDFRGHTPDIAPMLKSRGL